MSVFDLFRSEYIRLEVEYRKDGELSTIRLKIKKGYILRPSGWTIFHEIKSQMMLEEGIYEVEIVSILLL